MSEQDRQKPWDATAIKKMLEEANITNYEPAVINQILEFGHRYILSVLEDARACSEHAQKRRIDHDDIKLAVMMQLEDKFTTPPPRDLMLEVARTTNNIPLPYIKQNSGLVLPQKQQRILSCAQKPWKKVSPEPPKLFNQNRKHLVKTANQGSNAPTSQDSMPNIRPGCSTNLNSNDKQHQVTPSTSQQHVEHPMPPRPKIYPSQQVPPLPFPYPEYMKPFVVYIKEEPSSPLPEIENDLPPKDEEEDEL